MTIDLNRMSFLYVEDDEFSRDIMTMMFVRFLEAPNLYVFNDSSNFVERVKALPIKPSLIMLDIHMKPNSGFALLENLRSQPDFMTTPIVAVTASVMNEEVNKLHRAGFDGAIGKPIDAVVFPNLLMRLLNGEKVWHVIN